MQEEEFYLVKLTKKDMKYLEEPDAALINRKALFVTRHITFILSKEGFWSRTFSQSRMFKAFLATKKHEKITEDQAIDIINRVTLFNNI